MIALKSLRRVTKATAAALFSMLAAHVNAEQGGVATWTVFASSRKNLEASNYVALPVANESDGTLTTSSHGLPQAKIAATGESSWAFRARAEADKLVTGKRGDIILQWTVPESGDWELRIEAQNEGLDVKGGDGGRIVLTRLSANETVDTAQVFSLNLPPSKVEVALPQIATDLVALEAGDRLHLRFSANVDGYGDLFTGRFVAIRSAKPGRKIAARGYEAFIAQPPETVRGKGAPLRSGLFWMGVDGGWANSPFAEEAVRMIHRRIPDLAVVMIANKPERFNKPAFYDELGIPTIIQSWGSGYEPFLKAEGAFEVNWAGVDLSQEGVATLSGTAHAASLPHPATRRAFAQLSQSAIRSGYSGHGFCDMVWMWGAGRGATGHNSATVAAFRQDLLGEDAGIRVSLSGQSERVMKLRDYAEFYLGGLPTPQSLGFSGWADYQPPRKPEGQSPTFRPDYLLFDLLVHYEWLKLADFLGQTAEREGGFFQCMPNPEDMANGCDFYFLNALPSVRARSEEFFQSVSYIDGAYYRHNYLTSGRRGSQQSGLVLESGGGGNAWPYYDHEVAWLAAYELTLATGADHLEGDFWPGSQRTLAEVIKDRALAERARQIISFGLGFSHAKEDGARRLEPDFYSVSSRRIFRPWGADWHPWNWHLDNSPSPDLQLAQGGYVFQGVGEEALSAMADELAGHPLLYSPSTATEKGWRVLLAKLENGKIPAAVVAAPGIENMIMTDFRMRPLADIAPHYAHKRRPAGLWSGRVMAGERELLAVGELAGPLFSADGTHAVMTLGGQPLVARRLVGGRPLYIVLFDPSLSENAPVAAAVYGYLLDELGIRPRWTTPAGSYARVYRQDGGGLIVGVQSAGVRDWKTQTKGRPSPAARLAYAAPNQEVTARIQVKSDTAFACLALPSGQRGEAVSDKDGWLRLSAKNVSWQVFHVLPAGKKGDSRLDRMAKRPEIFRAAIALEEVRVE